MHDRSLIQRSGIDRRIFLKIASHAAAAAAFAPAALAAAPSAKKYEPFAMGLLIKPFPDPEPKIALVRQLGIPTCFLSLDDYIGKFTPGLVTKMRDALDKHQIVATTVEVVRPEPLKWNFLDGPSTIGIVPRAYRAARMDALKQVSDFAKQLGVDKVQTHCGFMPEDPKDPLYAETVQAIHELTLYCAGNGQSFLMETGQETPTTMLRVIKDVNHPALGVGLDTANLILYGKANPVDAVKILGPYIRAMHAKDGKWPTNPMELGQEVVIGKGEVDFAKVFTGLRAAGYKGAVSIERETSGPQQIEDVRQEKVYLEHVLAQTSNV
ncbi:sugar phosphate isomerase/epimerase family protein [Edaphobacter sp. HDX4]|uniref:sugar phosphate isomerase/epimerase family protein n=1 Tax=Edaphobacter sp. HDX4 TaxID=2794064 RepID=UPI002FE687BE